MSIKSYSLYVLICVLCFLCFTGSVGVQASAYTDTNHWAKNYIDYVTDENWFSGTSTTTFSPAETMTRGMFVTVLARFADANTSVSTVSSFSDVSSSAYYASAVNWAYGNGIVAGVSEKSFSPNESITREEAATILSRYLRANSIALPVRNNISIYSDEASISDWAYDAVYEMQKYGIFIGDNSNKVNPGQTFKRCEAAVVFVKMDGIVLDIYQVVSTPAPVEPGGTYLGEFKSSFYCAGSCCNGAWAGQTSLGVAPTVGKTIAVDPTYIKLGSWVYLEFTDARLQQYSGLYRAEDTGGAIKGYRIDVLLGSHAACTAAGVGSVKIYLQ